MYQIVNSTTGLDAGKSNPAANRDACTVVGAYKAITGGTSVGDPKIMVNGTETSIVLATANALYTKCYDSNQYPSNPAGIGMRSSGTTADTFLYECGVLVAYDATKGPMTIHRHRTIHEVRI
jgi:hypothetical protein